MARTMSGHGASWSVIGIAGWLRIYLPYHPIPLAERWAHRRPLGRMVIRWVTLVLLPYAVVPAINAAVALPAFAVWYHTVRFQGRIPEGELAVDVGLTVVFSIIAFVFGHRHGLRLIHRRRDRLIAYLGHPELGYRPRRCSGV